MSNIFKIQINSVALLVLVIFFKMCGVSYALEPNMHIGALEIHPSVAVEQKYDDNIFLETESNENSDWLTKTTIGCSLEMPLVAGREDDFKLETEYAMDIIEYWDETDQNRVDHNIKMMLDANFTNDMYLNIEDNYVRTADPPNSEQTRLERRFVNTLDVVVGYEREKIGLEVGYKNKRDNYKRTQSLDRYENVAMFDVFYDMGNYKTFVGYNYGEINYDENTTNSDSEYHQMHLGVVGKLAPKLTGTAKAGYRTSDYDNAARSDFSGAILELTLDYDIMERSKLKLTGKRSVDESNYATNSYYINNKIGLDYEHELMDRVYLLTNASYELNEYPKKSTENGVTAHREDDIYKAGVGVRYDMREWVSLETSYEYKTRDSGFNNFDYDDNRFMTKVVVEM